MIRTLDLYGEEIEIKITVRDEDFKYTSRGEVDPNYITTLKEWVATTHISHDLFFRLTEGEESLLHIEGLGDCLVGMYNFINHKLILIGSGALEEEKRCT